MDMHVTRSSLTTVQLSPKSSKDLQPEVCQKYSAVIAKHPKRRETNYECQRHLFTIVRSQLCHVHTPLYLVTLYTRSLPKVDASISFSQLLSDLDKSKYQVWPEAELGSCLRYGRGKHGLLIPSEWKGVDDLFRSMF